MGVTFDAVLHAVAEHEPRVVDDPPVWQAATALILHDHAQHGPEILFIERTSRPGDRWSGQMALPGGKRDPQDDDLATTARRETFEEVGIELGAPVARLDDVHGRGPMPGIVAPFVFTVPERPPLVPEPSEVADAVWIPLGHALAAENAVRYRYRGMIGPFPGVRYDRFTVWGLTHGILDDFCRVIGEELPRPGFTFG
jgi:8-oxo-dGTP pyrophosphatase MutT (NUDIX family)